MRKRNFNGWKSVNVIFHRGKNLWKNKSDIDISLDVENILLINPKPLLDREIRDIMDMSKHNKDSLQEVYRQCQVKWIEIQNNCPTINTKQGCLHLLYLISILLDILTIAISYLMEIRVIQIWKEDFKISLFADDVIVYISNSQISIKKLLHCLRKTT